MSTTEDPHSAASEEAPPQWAAHLRKQGFELGSSLGSGAFGRVYRASQGSLGRDVAVKFFAGTYVASTDFRKRFDREAHLLARIQHYAVPFVITRGVVRDDNTPYMVMELIEGETLRDYLNTKQRLPPAEAIALLTIVLDVLDHAHRATIVHRDVRPENIMMRSGSPVLIDFSLGVALEYSPGLTRATIRGRGVGDYLYASPEQQRDASSVDARTDIYSAGVVLHECLTGHAKTGVGIPDAVPEAAMWTEIVAKACAVNLPDRFQSAAEFQERLRRVASRVTAATEGACICPTPGCESGYLSETGYFRGPRLRTTRDRNCSTCGATLLRGCEGCGSPIPLDIETLVVTQSRASPDRRKAHCPGCGQRLYETPVCQKCGSFLRSADVSTDTASAGCTKCRNRARVPVVSRGEPPPLGDDDIPF